VSYLLSLFLVVCSLVYLFLNEYSIGVWVAFSSYLAFINFIRIRHGINSLFFAFMFFFGLYGYSIPISIFFGLDIGWHKVVKFKLWDQIDPTLFSFLISNQLALLALIVSHYFFDFKKVEYNTKPLKETFQSKSFLYLSLLMALVASGSEFLNFMRIGGLKALNTSKAFYQSSVSDLALDIPSQGFFYIAVALFALCIPFQLKKIRLILFFLILSSFFLFVNLKIGERGALVVAFAVAVLGYTYFHKIKTVKSSYFILGLLFFFLFNILTIVREPTASFTGLSFFKEQQRKLIYLANPANTEFATSAYNYRLYLDAIDNEFEPKLGASYIEVAVGMVPTYFIKDKPQTIAYEYRDMFHSERAQKGSIAGTGYSSLLEAYLNFHYLGPFIIYFLLGICLLFLEKFKYYPSVSFSLVYLMMFNIVMIFSRTASKSILNTLIFITAQMVVTYIIYKLFFKNKFAEGE
jgi:oligosaccharide repeat unit polymerase